MLVVALMADDVVFFESPVVFKPYVGREAVATLLHAVAQTFEDFSYVDQLEGADGSRVVSRRAWGTGGSAASTTCVSTRRERSHSSR